MLRLFRFIKEERNGIHIASKCLWKLKILQYKIKKLFNLKTLKSLSFPFEKKLDDQSTSNITLKLTSITN